MPAILAIDLCKVENIRRSLLPYSVYRIHDTHLATFIQNDHRTKYWPDSNVYIERVRPSGDCLVSIEVRTDS